MVTAAFSWLSLHPHGPGVTASSLLIVVLPPVPDRSTRFTSDPFCLRDRGSIPKLAGKALPLTDSSISPTSQGARPYAIVFRSSTYREYTQFSAECSLLRMHRTCLFVHRHRFHKYAIVKIAASSRPVKPIAASGFLSQQARVGNKSFPSRPLSLQHKRWWMDQYRRL